MLPNLRRILHGHTRAEVDRGQPQTISGPGVLKLVCLTVALGSGLGVTAYAPEAKAVPVTDAESRVSVFCSGEPVQAVAVPTGASLHCDVSLVNGPATGQAVARAMTSVDSSGAPQADVQADASSSDLVFLHVLASADAQLFFYFLVTQTAAPPAFAAVPLNLIIPSHIDKTGFGDASVSVDFNGTTVYALAAGSGDVSFDHVATVPLSVFPGRGGQIVKRASCAAQATSTASGASTHSDCQAVVDPIIEFDQAAFDALMGPSTFKLDDFFDIELSPNLATAFAPTAAPIAPTAALFISALLLLAGFRRNDRGQ